MELAPFIFGQLATSVDFTDREKESALLETNFRNRINTIIISPRRWGKTSLVNAVATKVSTQKSKIKVCQVDLFNVRTEEDFYTALAKEVLKATSTKWEEIMVNAKRFLSHLMPRISFSPDQREELSFGVGWEELKKNPDDILNLAESIAIAKNIRIVLCIDEFQSVAEFDAPVAFQRKLRAHWQRHTRVSYCLYGSKRHMMLDVFTNSSMPFYKFGDILFLQKIGTNEWVQFITKRFHDTKKEISEADAERIVSLADNHPYYVQQLAQQVWLRTARKCNRGIVETAFVSLINQLGLLFTNITELLPTSQLNFLKALVAGETQFSSQAVLLRYKLGTSSNITRIKKALLNRDIIDITGVKIDFQDPMYKYWIASHYFMIKK